MPRETVLIVDDEENILKNTARILQKAGYAIRTAGSGAQALACLKEQTFDIVLFDLVLPDMNGLELVEKLNESGHDSIIIIITGHGTIETAVNAIKKGAFHYVTKPIDYQALMLLMGEGLEKKRLIRENIALKNALSDKTSLAGIIGASKSMLSVVDMIKLAARTESNVLILGETGTGKELVADAIHYNSSRSKHPYRKVNCASLTETILESELFGHEPGAFTDARSQQKGYFELAHKGTLLLDEIGCMSPRTQSNFLRVLEDKKVKRLGSEKDILVDVRIIASTNEQLEKTIQAGGFRNDLYYRLNVVKIVLPPLRTRKEDLFPLVRHFLKKHSRDQEDISVAPQVMELFLEHDWPGNVRELENIIERAFIFDIAGELTPQHLPSDFMDTVAAPGPAVPDGDMTLEQCTEQFVLQTLDKAHGNQSEAARRLGVSRYFVAKFANREKP